MTNINVSTTTVEALYDTTPNVNVSTVTIETLYDTTPNVNVSTVTLEVMSLITYEQFNSISSEVLYNNANVDIDVQSVFMEVLLRFDNNNRRRPVYVAASV